MRKPHAPFDGTEPTSQNLKRQPWRGVGAPQTHFQLEPGLCSLAGSLALLRAGPRVRSGRRCAPDCPPARDSGPPRAAAQDEAGSPLALGVLLPLRVGAGHRLPLPLPGRSPAAARLPRAGRWLPRQRLRGPPVSSERRWGLGAPGGRGLGAGDAEWSGAGDKDSGGLGARGGGHWGGRGLGTRTVGAGGPGRRA